MRRDPYVSAQAEQALVILIDELRKGAAGPCDYWYRQLADRLAGRLYPSEAPQAVNSVTGTAAQSVRSADDMPSDIPEKS